MVLGSSKSRVKMGGDDPRFWVGMVLGSSKSRVGMGVDTDLDSRFWVEMVLGSSKSRVGMGLGHRSPPGFGWR